VGIPSQVATLILREHRFRPIAGKLLSIGRQTVYLTPSEAVDLVRRELGEPPRVEAGALALDRSTRGAHDKLVITDTAFYSLFCDIEYRCLDLNDYEGADIVFDLCGEIPSHLENRFDVIVDGSCLDNIFDPAAALRNLTRLLKPCGRIIHVDRTSRRHNVYVAFSLAWFHDYYALNDFNDCQVYLAQWDGDQISSRWDFYHYQPLREVNGAPTYFGQDRYFYPWRDAHAVIFAEKGEHSSWRKSPVQFEYRPQIRFTLVDGRREITPQCLPDDGTDPYVVAAFRFHQSPRPLFLRAEEKMAIPEQFLRYSPEMVYCGSIEATRVPTGLDAT
jgi:SAM-dependent methyltransferase